MVPQDGLVPLSSLARAALARWDVPEDSTLSLINVSENTTFRIDDVANGRRWALRVHRDGYHSRDAIASELAWAMALRADGAAVTPNPLPGHDGERIQSVAHPGLPRARNVVLFDWETGHEPPESDLAGFAMLGETAARMHEHVSRWPHPAWFQRHTWDFSTSLGDRPHWGFWRDGMGITPAIEAEFAATDALIEKRLCAFGTGPARFGLVHGDMRLANLLVDNGRVKVIDFDDCGFSWFLYDCATTVSFFEHKPEVPKLLNAWVEGYRRVRGLCGQDEAEIPTFVMLRRLLLVAWIGSHSETDLARSMGVEFTNGTVALCQNYRRQMSL